MNKRRYLSLLASAALGLGTLLPETAWAWSRAGDVEIEIVDDAGRELRQYPVETSAKRGSDRAYLEARRDANYSIRVRNYSRHRVGLVIAVDGRNIISGDKSFLGSNERKYVLNPRESAVYEGWRTGKNKVNRFYFTHAGDSYADAFGDHSAMGVIAVAVYRERSGQPQRLDDGEGGPQRRHGGDKNAAQPGTGYGEIEWSPSRAVRFEPEDRPVARRFLKYEWRSTLCHKGVIECRDPEPRNRFWPEDGRAENGGFAPPPPRERHSSHRR